MKETKRQRKLRVGMNYATRLAFRKGFKPPEFYDIGALPLQPSHFVKIDKGVPYVNPKNFGVN